MALGIIGPVAGLVTQRAKPGDGGSKQSVEDEPEPLARQPDPARSGLVQGRRPVDPGEARLLHSLADGAIDVSGE